MKLSKSAVCAGVIVCSGWMQIASAQTLVSHSQSSWTAPFTVPLVPAAGSNLPDGRVLMWSATRKDNYSPRRNRTSMSIFDPVQMTATDKLVQNTNHDMFCPGTTQLADGRLMVTDGGSDRATSIFDPATNLWTTGDSLNIARGYHSSTLLDDGSVFTIGGSWSFGRGNKDGEIWREGEGWRLLPNVLAEQMLTDDPEGVYRSDNHMWLYQAPNKRIFQAGPSRTMHWIDVEGNGSVTVAGERSDDADAMNGNALMYDIGKILTLGGSPTYSLHSDGSNRSYRIDITGDQAQVTRSGDMHYARTFNNALVLPSGEVVVIGGMAKAITFSDEDAVLPAEIWNPETDSWRELAPMQVPRTYHSFGLLLKDGRVLAGGGGLCGNCGVNHPDVEILTPPYLLNADGSDATRPQFSSHIVDRAMNGSSIKVTMDTAQSHDFALVRTSASTHSTNNDQRRIPLEVMAHSGNDFELIIPANAAVAPPGDYFLFAMNASGVPSVAEIIRIQSVFGEVALADVFGGFVSADINGEMNTTATSIGPNEVFTLSQAGDKVALQSAHGQYVTAFRNRSVRATASVVAGWEQFDMNSFDDTSYSFLGAFRRYLSSNSDGVLKANPRQAGVAESFALVDPDPVQQITILGNSGNYLSADIQGNATATSDEADGNAIWTIEQVGQGTVALKSSHGFYMSALRNGRLQVNRSQVLGWEKYDLIRNDDGTISLRSVHGKYIRVLDDNTVRADATTVQNQTKLRPSFITGE
ncbi:DUF1929 domain-containing protein [bacterium]|nr:DUF1929 domain-containing protein [bacterium]